MTSPTTTTAWDALIAIAASARASVRASAAIANSAASAIKPIEMVVPQSTAEGGLDDTAKSPIFADFSRHAIDQECLNALSALAEQMEVGKKRDAMFAGSAINVTEERCVLHTALRADPRNTTPLLVDGVDVRPLILAELKKMENFSSAVRSGRRRGISGQAFTDVVNIGIGGSYLGPAFVCTALAGAPANADASRNKSSPRVHFVANIDGANLEQVLAGLNPATTLFTVTSKTFTTDETMTNACSAEAWLVAALGADAVPAHFVAITANPTLAKRAGYTDETIFTFWDWVGGRYSLWSAAGLPIALAGGYAQFADLLAGARDMDHHFCDTPPAQNLPMMLALTGIWNRNFLNLTAHAVLPYAERLRLLPNHLQQVEMESTGKSVDLDGNAVTYSTCPVIFGEVGTNGQHSFHQLLHQSTDAISADILLVAEPQSGLKGHHEKLLANGIAQADALWQGRSTEAAFTDLAGKNLSDDQQHFLAAHRACPGRRPVTVLVLPKINAYYVGALAAMYEHKVFTQGAIWNVGTFDQWGVELGKSIATSLLPMLSEPVESAAEHLQLLLEHLRTSH